MTIERLSGELASLLKVLLPAFRITDTPPDGITRGQPALYLTGQNRNFSMLVRPQEYLGYVNAGGSLNSIAEKIADEAVQASKAADLITEDKLRDPERLRAVPAYKGMDLSGVPHYDVPGTDISLVARIVFEKDRNSEMSVLVKNEHLPLYDSDPADLLKKAMDMTRLNSRFRIRPLAEQLAALDADHSLGDLPDRMEADRKLWVITNDRSYYGASAIAYPALLEEARRLIGEDYFILPSSCHELLALGISGLTEDITIRSLTDLVEFVNATQVAPKERLSDIVYYFNGQSLSAASPC